MAERFDKFTERARQVQSHAQEEAERFNHNYIGTEHQLLGLIRVEEGIGARVLVELGIELEEVRSAVERIVGRGDGVVTGEIGLTPRARRVIEIGVQEARRFNHHYIGTEHLLLGLVREGDGIAAGVLKRLGVNLDEARRKTVHLLADSPVRGAGSDAPWPERGVKRYNLALPEDLYDEVQALADRQHTTVVEVLRRFIRLGLLATDVQERTGAALVIRDGDREREILLL